MIKRKVNGVNSKSKDGKKYLIESQALERSLLNEISSELTNTKDKNKNSSNKK